MSVRRFGKPETRFDAGQPIIVATQDLISVGDVLTQARHMSGLKLTLPIPDICFYADPRSCCMDLSTS